MGDRVTVGYPAPVDKVQVEFGDLAGGPEVAVEVDGGLPGALGTRPMASQARRPMEQFEMLMGYTAKIVSVVPASFGLISRRLALAWPTHESGGWPSGHGAEG